MEGTLCLVEPVVMVKCIKTGSIPRRAKGVFLRVKRSLTGLSKSLNQPRRPSKTGLVVVRQIEITSAPQQEALHLIQRKAEGNRIPTEINDVTVNHIIADKAVRVLDGAMNFHQSDCIAEARNQLRDLSRLMANVNAKNLSVPTKYFWQVVSRGKDLLFEGSVSCSVQHGTIILDSSNGGAQFYVNLLNIVGALALETSEFQIAKETFAVLIGFHEISEATSRLRDLGAAYNNRGCVSLIIGDFKQAESDFKNSLRHFNCEKRKQPHGSAVDATIIAVKSNFSRLDVMSRNFARAFDEQEKLVNVCKSEMHGLPFQTVFMVIHNQAVLHTTLGNLPKAEDELRWMVRYCNTMRREECDLLLNFVALQLCEVLLLRGKPEEANKVSPFEVLTTVSVHEPMPAFGGLHFNVRIEAFEKTVDVFVKSGRIRFACELLDKGLKIVSDAFGSDHFNVASLHSKKGSILKLTGDFSGSLKNLKCSEKILGAIFGSEHPLLMECYMSLGDVALQLGRTDESHLYFQRAMENAEVNYQVSFRDQLSMTYIKITRNSNDIPFGVFEEGKMREQMVEGLVAEYGQAIAVLLSRIHVKDRRASRGTRTKGKQPLQEKKGKLQCPQSVLIISQKCIRDLLQSGQAMLHRGMTKEAAAFFQRASRYCQAYHVAQGQCNVSLVRLYTVFSQTSLMNRSKGEKNQVLNTYLEELTDIATNNRIEDRLEGSSKDKETLTFDSQLNLKLVLILLILISTQLKMQETTFAAHDLYASLSPDNKKGILFLNDRLQIYASRTTITSNGKTAVQDFLFTSAIGLTKNDSEGQLAGKPLFRSLALKNNVPTNSVLATYSASAFLDIGGVKRLEQKMLSSLQEYFEINYLDSERKTTQVVVDVTGSRIELLPLCFSGKDDTGEIHSEGSNICSIFPFLCEKTTCMTFADEPTCCFMFSRIGIWLLQQGNSGKISVLRVQNQCLVLTVTDPLKAKITLWYEGRSIKQKVQLIDTAVENHEHSENPSCCCRAFDKFSPSAILQWAKTREMACQATEVEHQCSQSVEIPIVSDVSSELNGIPLDDRQTEKPSTPIFSEETEEYDGLRKCFKVSTLECLTTISEISRQIYGNVVLENGDFVGEQSEAQTDHMSLVPDPNVAPDPNTISSPSGQDTIFSPPKQEAVCSDFQQAFSSHEASTESQNLPLSLVPDSATTEAKYLSLREGTTTNEANVDAKQLGRKLFEKDKKARSSFVATFSKDLKGKEESRKMILLEDSECSSNETSEEAVVGEPTHNGAGHDESGKSDWKVCDVEKALDFEESKEGCSSSEEVKMPSSCENLQTTDENERADVLPTSKEATKEVSANTDFKPVKELIQGATEDNQNEIMENFLTNKGADNAMLKQASLVSQRKCETGFSDYSQMHHQQRDGLQMGSRRKTQSEDLDRAHGEIDPDERREDYLYLSKEMKEKEKENIYETGISNKRITSQTKMSGLTSQENDEAFFEGPWEQYLSNFSGDDTHARLWNSQSGESVDKQSGAFAGNSKRKDDSLLLSSGKEVHSEDWTKTTCRQFLDDDVIADGDVTYNLPQTDQDVVDGPILMPKKPWKTHSNKVAVSLLGGEEATRGRSRGDVQKLSADEPVKNGNPIPFEARDVVDGPVDPRGVDSSVRYISPVFGGARPKQVFSNALRNSGTSSKLMYPVNHQTEKGPIGLDPGFVARHAVTNNSLNSSFGYLNCNGATWENASDDPYFSANYCNNNGSPKILGERSLQKSNMPKMGSKIPCSASEAFQERYSLHSNVQFTASYQAPTVKQDESWHFPPLPNTTEKQALSHLVTTHGNQRRATQQNSTQVLNPLFDLPGTQSPYNDMVSMTNEFYSRSGGYGDGKINSPGNSQADSAAVSVGQRDSAEDGTDSLLACLAKAMTRTVKLFASSDNVGKHAESEGKPVEKISVQEQASGDGENESTDSVEELNSREHAALLPQNDQTVDTVAEVPRTPVQESPRPVCSHYQRRCLVRFSCCGKFFPCHRCHNDSKACDYNQARAINATHIRCTICYHEQAIDEGSQQCRGCNSKMSAYFCAICKHFTSVDKNPFHCEKCGICRIHSDKSFHCDVCNVCLDKRLQGKHKCRPDSGHDECCICLEDAFSGCQILPCSHKVHKDCAIAMVQNGVRTCPICRHPLFKQPENATQ